MGGHSLSVCGVSTEMVHFLDRISVSTVIGSQVHTVVLFIRFYGGILCVFVLVYLLGGRCPQLDPRFYYQDILGLYVYMGMIPCVCAVYLQDVLFLVCPVC